MVFKSPQDIGHKSQCCPPSCGSPAGKLPCSPSLQDTAQQCPAHPLLLTTLTKPVIRGRHRVCDGERHRTQLSALGYNNIDQAPPEAGDGISGLFHTALMSHHRGSGQLLGIAQVISMAADQHLERKDWGSSCVWGRSLHSPVLCRAIGGEQRGS